MARARDTVDYPANFILVATANPCPCGYYAGAGTCACSPHHVKQYERRLSGPILDRIDLCTTVHDVKYAKLLRQAANRKSDRADMAQVRRARKVQATRFGQPGKLNSDMTNADIKRHGNITPEAEATLNTAARSVKLSARAYMRTVKVARTIADLDRSPDIKATHITEAITYRITNQEAING